MSTYTETTKTLEALAKTAYEIRKKLRCAVYTTWFRFNPLLMLSKAALGKNLKILGRANIHILPGGRLVVGNNVRICSGFRNNPVGSGTKAGFWVKRGGRLHIGDDVGISNTVIVCSRSIEIGPGTLIGGGCEIYDSDFHPLDPVERAKGQEPEASGIKIGRNVFVGANSIILKGVEVGDEVVIGAGSVVTKDIPPRQVWAGNPAKYIKTL